MAEHVPRDPFREGQVFGRRNVFRLKPAQKRVLDTVVPSLAIDPQLVRAAAEPDAPAFDPKTLFPFPITELHLEIGFGGGEHLLGLSAESADAGFIGCEPFMTGVARLAAAAETAGRRNIRLWPEDARPLLAALPSGCLAACYLMFSDPWPKRRHWKRRVIQPETLDQIARCLALGAPFRVASDDAGLVAWSLMHVLDHPEFIWTAARPEDWRRRPPGWPETRYAAKALQAGREPAYLAFERRSY